MKILQCICIFFLAFKVSYADEQRIRTVFKSHNKNFTLKYSKKEWTLLNNKGTAIYKINDIGFTSMTILISNDGKRIVIIDDFMESKDPRKRNALYFYNQGVLTKTYNFSDIVASVCNVAFSVWHTSWCLEDFSLKQSDSIFSLATYEFNEFEFNSFTGEIIRKDKPKGFDENTLIVLGFFNKDDSENALMKIEKYIDGPLQPENEVLFKTKGFGKGRWYRVLMIKDGVDATPNRFRNSFITINNCLNSYYKTKSIEK